MIGSADTGVTLTQFYDLSQKAKDNQIEKNHRPILFLETVNGQKQLKVLDDRSKLPFITRALAYFGLGSASLTSVKEFLQSRNITELKSSKEDKVLKCFQSLNEKIQSRNTHSLKKIEKLNLPITVSHYESAASTTCHPEGSTPEKDASGILDFAQVFPEFCAAYVADGTGHGNPKVRDVIKPIWDNFNDTFKKEYKSVEGTFKSDDQIENFLRTLTKNLNKKFEDVGRQSTFNFAVLININGKTHVASIHTGDGTLFHITKDGSVNNITPTKGDFRKAELGNTSPVHFDIREVKSGDRIVGLTDGITDFIPPNQLENILRNNKSNLLPVFEQEMENFAKNEETVPDIKKLDPTDRHRSDDISVFSMTVP